MTDERQAGCWTCNGQGWVARTTADPLPSGEPGEPYQVQETCPDCGGSGIANPYQENDPAHEVEARLPGLTLGEHHLYPASVSPATESIPPRPSPKSRLRRSGNASTAAQRHAKTATGPVARIYRRGSPPPPLRMRRRRGDR